MNALLESLKSLGQVVPYVARLLQVGKPGDVSPWDPEQLRLIRKLRLGRRLSPSMCYRNSQRALNRLGSKQRRVRYCEGFASPGFNHAWLELDGKVLDLTRDRTENEYFGVLVPLRVIIQYALKTGEYGPILDDCEYGFQFSRQVLGPPHRWPKRAI